MLRRKWDRSGWRVPSDRSPLATARAARPGCRTRPVPWPACAVGERGVADAAAMNKASTTMACRHGALGHYSSRPLRGQVNTSTGVYSKSVTISGPGTPAISRFSLSPRITGQIASARRIVVVGQGQPAGFTGMDCIYLDTPEFPPLSGEIRRSTALSLDSRRSGLFATHRGRGGRREGRDAGRDRDRVSRSR